MPLRKLSACALFFLAIIGSGQAAPVPPTGLDQRGQLVVVDDITSDFSFVRLQSGVQIRVQDVVKNILFYGPDIVRVNTTLGASHSVQPSIVVVLAPTQVHFDVKETTDDLDIRSDRLHILVAKSSGALTFMDSNGKVLTR